jgi:hypothetical protein
MRASWSCPVEVPSHDTFGDVLAAVDPDALETAFCERADSLREKDTTDIVALDGKVVARLCAGAETRAAEATISSLRMPAADNLS